VKRRWFHCSSRWLGGRFRAEMRAPIIRGPKEPVTPRICVCPTLAGCFSAVLFVAGPVYVYRTVKAISGVKPVRVFDELVTWEKWIVHPAEFEAVQCIPAAVVLRAQQAIDLWHRETHLSSSLKLKVCQRAIACRVLGGPEWEADLCARWMKTCGIDDPEDFVLRCTVSVVNPERGGGDVYGTVCDSSSVVH
jgi:hypothetical protein